MAERARMELDAGDSPVWMPVDVVRRREVVGEPGFVEHAELHERSVQRGYVVPLGQNQKVTAWVIGARRVEVQKAAIEEGNEVGTRQRGAEKAPSAARHSNDVAPHA